MNSMNPNRRAPRLLEWTAFAFAAALVAACADRAPARLEVGVSDTVVINTPRRVPIPFEVVDSSGRPLRARPRFQWLSGDPVRVSSDGSVTCVGRADARVRASVETMSTEFVLYCRPMRDFAFFLSHNRYSLWLGQSPQPIALVGDGTDGRPVTLIAARLRVKDTSVASLEHGRIVPHRPGTTTIRVDAGDATIRLSVEVIRRVDSPAELRPYEAFIGRLRLRDDEYRAWPVLPGRYEIRFMPDSGHQAQPAFATTAANCARYAEGGPHFSCVASPGAILAFTGAALGGSAVAGNVFIRRMSDASDGTDYWFDVSRQR